MHTMEYSGKRSAKYMRFFSLFFLMNPTIWGSQLHTEICYRFAVPEKYHLSIQPNCIFLAFFPICFFLCLFEVVALNVVLCVFVCM